MFGMDARTLLDIEWASITPQTEKDWTGKVHQHDKAIKINNAYQRALGLQHQKSSLKSDQRFYNNKECNPENLTGWQVYDKSHSKQSQ